MPISNPSIVGQVRPSRLLEPLEPRTLLSAQLVADLNLSPGSSLRLPDQQAIGAGGITYFVADDGAHGAEVWRTDGTSDGTALVRDVIPGPQGSQPILLGTAGDHAFFQTYGQQGWQLWQTDPATGGASPVVPDNTWVDPAFAKPSAALGDDFYFAGNSGLFRIHDGTLTRVAELGASFVEPVKMVAAGPDLYVLTRNNGLWVSDGTTEGTHLVRQTGPSFGPADPDLVAAGDTAYFTVPNTSTLRLEVWKTQGTEATTTLVAELAQNTPSTTLAAAGGRVFFWNRGPQPSPDFTLWTTDGSAEGTGAIQTIPGSGFNQNPPALVTSGSRVFAPTPDGKLWTSDGTPTGTGEIGADLDLRLPYLQSGRTTLLASGGTLFFIADQNFSSTGRQLWSTDGTDAGTRQVAWLATDPNAPGASLIGMSGSRPLLSMFDPAYGTEPWVLDDAAGPAGVRLLKDINTGTADAEIGRPVSLDGRLIVPAGDALWAFPSPGAAGQRLTVGVGGPQVYNTGAIARVGNQIFFAAFVDSLFNAQLCVTDGTPQGTRIVTDLGVGGLPFQGFAVGDRFYFTRSDGQGETLGVSDGTADGTRTLTSALTILNAGLYRDRPLATFNGRLYFSLQNPTYGTEQLWSTDGTPEGTSVVTANAPAPSAVIWSMIPTGGQLYFLWGYRLYRTDGTAAGTVPVGTGTYNRIEPTDDGSLLLFPELGPIARLAPGSTTPATLLDNVSGRADTARIGKWIYFVGSTPTSSGIFRTDGTPQGTTQVAVAPDAADLTAAGGAVYFTDDSDGAGREVWVTDGTPAGTRRVSDVAPGAGSGLPEHLIDAGGTLYFTAEDGVHGRELWRVIDDVAPTALASNFNYAARVQTLTITFSEDVASSLTLSDWKLADRATGKDVSTLLTSLAFDPGTHIATLTLAANLPRGDYRLTLPAGAAADAEGNPTLADVSLDFFHLPGDVNRDRTVNFADLLILAKNYNNTAATYAQGDLTGDGTVNFADLLLLARNYSTTLPTPPPPPPPAPALAPLTATAPSKSKQQSVFRVTPTPPKPAPAPPKRPAAPARKRA